MQEQVLHLFHKEGFKIRRIAKALKLSRNTVRGILREGVKPPGEPAAPDWARPVDWEKVKRDYHCGVTLKVLHAEMAPADVTYKVFWHYFRTLVPAPTESVTIRLEHKPAEKTFFDFADGIDIVDRKTGKRTKTQLFSAVLPFSSLVAGDFVLDQKQPTLIRAMEDAFYEIGGVTPNTVVDNLRSAVRKSHLYDPDVNQTFVEFANHWGFAVLPARPYRPKDKAAVECGIGVTQRQFFNEVRERTFYSLSELNAAYRDFKRRLNAAPMKDHGDLSRNDRFAKERPFLKPLPTERYELAEWKTVRVHPDCHVQVERRFYSVPYIYVSQELRVRIRSKLVEVFNDDNEPVAVHPRLFGMDRASTLDAHYPEQKVAVARFEVRAALTTSKKIGPNTHRLVESLVAGTHPLKHLRRIQGILRLCQSGAVKTQSLEYASDQAMKFNKRNFSYVKQAALFFENGGSKPRLITPQRDASDLYLHHNHEEKP
jgi:transposase